jgi:gliding motility-associated-like protein
MCFKIKYHNRIAALLVFVCSILRTSAQKEGFVWHFGVEAGIEFSSGGPKLVPKSSMATSEGCASYSDANGNLLFYTNGGGRDPLQSGQTSGKIWNRNHEVMYDMGNTEGGGFSAAQSSVILPKPGAPGRYLLFTMEEVEFDIGGEVAGQPDGRGLSYFEVDMGLNGGLGGVAKHMPSIYVPTYEGLCAVRHTNGTDYWILVFQSNGPGLAVFSVTATGVSAPKTYNLPLPVSGIIKASPDGRWLAIRGNSSSLVSQFDPETGGVLASVVYPQAFAGFEFAPDSRRLYYQNSRKIYALSLMPGTLPAAVEIGALVQEPGTNLSVGQFQVAPDNKIYFITQNRSRSITLSAIACPNGPGAFVQQNVVYLRGWNEDKTNYFCLPNFSNHLFRNDEMPPVKAELGSDRTLCTGTPLRLSPGVVPNVQYKWSNGSTAASITVTQGGTYAVTVTGTGCAFGSDTVNVKYEDLTLSAGPDQKVCDLDSIQLNAVSNTSNVYWGPDELPSIPNPKAPLKDGVNVFEVTANYDACSKTDSIVITKGTTPAVKIMPSDTLIAKGKSVRLSVSGGNPGVAYSWAPAAGLSCSNCPNPVATPAESTVYTLTVDDGNGCSKTFTANVRVEKPDCAALFANLKVVPSEALIAEGDSVKLSVSGGVSKTVYKWTPVEGLSCSACAGPVAFPKKTTVYTVTASNDSTGCSKTLDVEVRIKEPDCEVEYPNAFTPNNDGINDAFFPANKDGDKAKFVDVNLQIFNRWGELVYSGKEKWDGTVQGEDAPADVYVYRVSLMLCGKPKSHVADITLLR